MGISEKKCPSCGGAMRFDPESGKSVCDFCGSVFDIVETDFDAASTPVEQGFGIEGFDFNECLENVQSKEAESLPIYNCVSCGAEVITTATEFSLKCPYCGNNIIITDKVSGRLRPDAVVPFKITPKELPAAMNRFYKNKALLPKDFFTESSMSKVTGVYVPFWIFSGKLSGRLVYNAERSRSYKSGDYRITETDHYSLERDISVGFNQLPVDASQHMDDALMDSIEPFDFNEAKSFNTDYFQGFTAERFDESMDDTSQRAIKRMENTAKGSLMHEATSGYQSPSLAGGKLFADVKAKYMLLPVYLFSLQYGGIDYQFAVNGQSGKAVGKLPTSKKRSAAYFLLRAGIVAAAIMGLTFISYLNGG